MESGELLCHMIFAVGEWGNGRLESPDGAHCVYIGGSTGGLTRELVDKRQPPSFLDFITCMLASALVLAVARPCHPFPLTQGRCSILIHEEVASSSVPPLTVGNWLHNSAWVRASPMDVKTHHFTRSPSTRVRPIIVYYRDECVLRVLVLMFTPPSLLYCGLRTSSCAGKNRCTARPREAGAAIASIGIDRLERHDSSWLAMHVVALDANPKSCIRWT